MKRDFARLSYYTIKSSSPGKFYCYVELFYSYFDHLLFLCLLPQVDYRRPSVDSFILIRLEFNREGRGANSMRELVVDSIRVSLMNYQRCVLLKEKDNSRFLPIWIGAAEADAIAVKLQGVTVQRPLTHDLIQSIFDAFGAHVSSIVVNDMKSDTFFAKIIVNIDGNQLEIDSRPSDAIALAVRVQVPIFAEENVLDRAGIWLDKETGKLLPDETEKTDTKNKTTEAKKVTEEEIKRISAFYEFIKDLNLDDFDKRKS